MRELTRDVNVNYIEIVSPHQGWSWDLVRADGAREGNTILWFILNGRLSVKSSSPWEISANHIFEIRYFEDPISLTALTPDASLAMVSFHSRNAGLRPTSNRCLTSLDPTFTQGLVERTYHRWLKRQQSEANALLVVLLDELAPVAGMVEPELDTKLAHQLTQAKLKNIAWSRTQRVIPYS